MNSAMTIMILSVLFVLPAQAQRIPDTVQAGLHGKAREVRDELGTATKFNEKGDIIEVLSQTSRCPKITYSYNDDGSRTIVKWCDGRATSSGEPRHPVPTTYKQSYKFDPLGRMIEMLTCNNQSGSPTDCEQIVYVYTERGFVTEEIHHIPIGPQVLRIVYARDTKGRVRVTTRIGAGGLSTTFFNYGSDEFPVESITYHPRGYEVERRTTYRDRRFDSQGNWVSVAVNDRIVYENGVTVDLSRPESRRVISFREEENNSYTVGLFLITDEARSNNGMHPTRNQHGCHSSAWMPLTIRAGG